MEKSAKTTSAKSFSISEALRYGFNFFKANLVTFIKLGGVLLVINILSNMVTEALKGSALSLIWGLISFAISLLVQIGSIKIVLDLYDKKQLNFSHLYSHSSLFLRYLGASILYVIAVGIGFILLIIPGIYLAIKWQFYSFLIVDKNMGIMESFKKSSAMTEGVKWKLFLFALALAVINILGALVLVVGLIVTIPTTVMATIYIYRKLLSHHSKS
ncbi:MAG: hypothetical protein AAB521_00780 [Patescibacteria group bacterium]